jgi:hypothetical protein
MPTTWAAGFTTGTAPILFSSMVSMTSLTSNRRLEVQSGQGHQIIHQRRRRGSAKVAVADHPAQLAFGIDDGQVTDVEIAHHLPGPRDAGGLGNDQGIATHDLGDLHASSFRASAEQVPFRHPRRAPSEPDSRRPRPWPRPFRGRTPAKRANFAWSLAPRATDAGTAANLDGGAPPRAGHRAELSWPTSCFRGSSCSHPAHERAVRPG